MYGVSSPIHSLTPGMNSSCVHREHDSPLGHCWLSHLYTWHVQKRIEGKVNPIMSSHLGAPAILASQLVHQGKWIFFQIFPEHVIVLESPTIFLDRQIAIRDLYGKYSSIWRL